MDLIAPSAVRVERHTAPELNRRIAEQTRARLRRIGDEPAAIAQRLRELDREWDIERALQANAATLALTGTVLAATVDRRFLALPLAVTAFLLQHAVQGWCPPLPLMRRLGFRTPREIEDERHELLERSGRPASPVHDAERSGPRRVKMQETARPAARRAPPRGRKTRR